MVFLMISLTSFVLSFFCSTRSVRYGTERQFLQSRVQWPSQALTSTQEHKIRYIIALVPRYLDRNKPIPFCLRQILSAGVFTFTLLGLGSILLGQGLKTPRAQIGWEVLTGAELRLVALPSEAAPVLPRWREHGHQNEPRSSILSSNWESALATRMQKVLGQAVQVVNDYLPQKFDQNFQLWIFEDIPYAAKTLDPHLILSANLLRAEDGERLPLVLAHEIHHLALMRTGLLKLHASARANILGGLLTEGIATWLSLRSGLFPELDQILQDPQQLKASFDRVRQALSGSGPDTRETATELYQQNKWGYYVGCWMIQQIEEQLGREAWLRLLNTSSEEASQELVELYLLTDPPPEYRF